MLYKFTAERKYNMKNIKKILTGVLGAALLTAALASCGKPFTCDLCGKEKEGTSYEAKVLGEKLTVCEDCHDDLEKLKNLK